MSEMDQGYGSEWNLAQHLRRHAKALDRAVEKVTGGWDVRWLDRPVDGRTGKPAKEWKGLDFLAPGPALEAAWSDFWPTGRGIHYWDAVGKVTVNGRAQWLLVEAKGHQDEIMSHCRACPEGGLPKIRKAFRRTKAAMGVDASANWESPYYQYAKRLAALHFLTAEGIPAHLLFIYFVGNAVEGRSCPQSKKEWEPALQAVCTHLGVHGTSELEWRVHKMFLRAFPHRPLKVEV